MFCPRFYPAGFNSSKWFIYFVLSTSKIQNIFYVCKFSIRFLHFSQKIIFFPSPQLNPIPLLFRFFRRSSPYRRSGSAPVQTHIERRQAGGGVVPLGVPARYRLLPSRSVGAASFDKIIARAKGRSDTVSGGGVSAKLRAPAAAHPIHKGEGGRVVAYTGGVSQKKRGNASPCYYNGEN